jgi:patatin-like phospholipase/acyl hydrolase
LDTKYFRILSIDGGGTRGILPARLITNIAQRLNDGRPFIHNFDLIAGTSTGGIIALGLALGIEPNKIVELYENLIPIVFGKKRFNLLKSKYDSGVLQDELKEFFGDSTLADLKADVVITSVSLQNATPRLYKTDYFTRNQGREDEKILDIALGTSAAPTYFNSHTCKYSSNLIDGGVCANNPSMIALTDALYFKRDSKSGGRIPFGDIGANRLGNIALLSLGTGDQCAMPYDYKKLATGGKLHWAGNIFQIVTDSQSKLIDFQIKSFLEDRYKRVNPKLTFASSLDDIDAPEYTKNLSDIPVDLAAWLDKYLI